jgi:pyrroloquinoline quinone (PQQ) biosynthesis protein C
MLKVQVEPKKQYMIAVPSRDLKEKLRSLKIAEWEPFYSVLERLIKFYETNNCPKIEETDSHV